MYVGLIFSVPAVSFDLGSFSFEVSICGSSAKHNAAPKKQSAKIKPVVFIFMRAIESGSQFPVNIFVRIFDSAGKLFAAENPPSACGDILKFAPDGVPIVFASDVGVPQENGGPQYLAIQP